MEIVAQTVAISTKEKQAAIQEREDKKKITIKPFKINDGSSPIKNSAEIARDETQTGLKPTAKPKTESEKGRKSRSRSRSSTSKSSGSSRSRSSSGSSSHSGDSSSSSSGSSHSEHSRPRSRHSGSIPRRAGSPSFLDRRRITSARKRPIPYHRPADSTHGSPSGSSRSSSVCSRRSLSP